MAATAASSSSSNLTLQGKHDVFLSFRGEDTRYNFTSYLYAALRDKSIHTFIDCNDIVRGEEISLALLKAIEESKISIIILSENYASSSWCLDELLKILECKNTNGQLVVPVFYRVEPSDVRNQTGSFAEAFDKHELKGNPDKVQKWKDALTNVANLAGHTWQPNRPEATLVDNIVEDIKRNLYHTSGVTSSVDLRSLVGIGSRIEKIEQLLDIGLESARIVVGIWGMGGIGKSTIAKAIFDKISNQFEGCCFLNNVREASEERDGVVSLRKKLLGEILRDESIKSGTVSLESKFIFDRLGRKKVLIVLDDVDDSSQLESIIGRFDWFCKGSRIIITTRNQQVLKNGVEIYEVDKLNVDEALRLLSLEAFKQNYPTEDFMELSEMVVNYAQGIPLALKVLGSFLSGRSKREWKGALDRLKEAPNSKIQEVLRISYNGLPQTEKDIFCDIAWFFKGWNKDRVMKILDGCGLFPDIGINVLVEKSLITISNNILGMHDLLQEMGLEIVREVSKEPGKRSRLRNLKDVYHVLTEETGTEAVEGIFLDSSSSFKLSEASLRSTAFQGMCNLRYLKLDCHDKLHFPDGLKYLSNKLSYLEWPNYPLESLPLNFHPENLVDLDMSYSRVKYLWEGTWPFFKLKVIKLKYCRDLIKIPDLSGAPNLEHMDLSGCASLLEVHSSIQYLSKLMVLNLRECKKLTSLPSTIKLKSLTELDLKHCSNLKELPDSLGNLSSLRGLILDNCSNLELLPDSLGNLSSVRGLLLDNCSNLKLLPDSLGNLSSLEMLNLNRCSNLKRLPDSLGNLSSLRELNLNNCSNLKRLPDSLGNLSSLRQLNLNNCSNLKLLPDSLGNLLSLRWLYLRDYTNLKELPDSLGNLSSLEVLDLDGCSNPKELPDSLGNLLSLRRLYLKDHSNLMELPDSLGNLSSLEVLHLDGCSNLKELPDSLGNLSSLQRLHLEGCSNLKELPDSLGNLSSLQRLHLKGCSNLKELPDSLGNLSSLRSLSLMEKNIVSMPASIKHLSPLTSLELLNYKRLQSLPQLPSCVKKILADNCISLQTVSFSSSTSSIRVIGMEQDLPISMEFIYENCWNLDLPSDSIFLSDAQLKKIQRLASTILKKENDYIKDLGFMALPIFQLICPGTVIPGWFTYRSATFLLSASLPLNWVIRKIFGFALCAIVSSKDNYCGVDCKIQTLNGVDYVLSRLSDSHMIGSESEHMFLWAVSCWNQFGDDWTYNNKISFQFLADGGVVKRCGVHPLYAQDEDECNLSMIQSRSHNEDCSLGEIPMSLIPSRSFFWY